MTLWPVWYIKKPNTLEEQNILFYRAEANFIQIKIHFLAVKVHRTHKLIKTRKQKEEKGKR